MAKKDKVIVIFFILLILSLFTLSSKADVCEPGMIYLEKGDAAPCAGYLIDSSTEEYFNDLWEANEVLKKSLDVTNEILKETNNQLVLCENQVLHCEAALGKIDKQITVKQTKNNLTYLGIGIVLGIIVNGLR